MTGQDAPTAREVPQELAGTTVKLGSPVSAGCTVMAAVPVLVTVTTGLLRALPTRFVPKSKVVALTEAEEAADAGVVEVVELLLPELQPATTRRTGRERQESSRFMDVAFLRS